MRRMLMFAMVVWLTGIGVVQAQTSSQANSPARVGQPTQQAGVASTTMAPLPPATTGSMPNQATATPSGSTASSSSNETPSSAAVSNAASASDPLSVPTSTTPTSGEVTTGAATAGAISSLPLVNPQKAVQLPGEGANTSTQAPTTSASPSGGAAAGTSSNAACFTAVPTTTGASGAGGLFGVDSVGGC